MASLPVPHARVVHVCMHVWCLRELFTPRVSSAFHAVLQARVDMGAVYKFLTTSPETPWAHGENRVCNLEPPHLSHPRSLTLARPPMAGRTFRDVETLHRGAARVAAL